MICGIVLFLVINKLLKHEKLAPKKEKEKEREREKLLGTTLSSLFEIENKDSHIIRFHTDSVLKKKLKDQEVETDTQTFPLQHSERQGMEGRK